MFLFISDPLMMNMALYEGLEKYYSQFIFSGQFHLFLRLIIPSDIRLEGQISESLLGEIHIFIVRFLAETWISNKKCQTGRETESPEPFP